MSKESFNEIVEKLGNDIHLKRFKIGCDIEEESGASALYAYLGLCSWREDAYPYIDDIVVVCSGSLEDGSFKNNLRKFIVDAKDESIDTIVTMVQKEFDER